MRGKILKGATQLVHYLLPHWIHEGDIVIDATCGNGNDTLKLAQLVGDAGKVIAFDIQEQALASTKEKVDSYNYNNQVQFILDSHENMSQYVGEEVDFIIFNLGYLPRADKSITTKVESTLRAMDDGLSLLKTHGIMVVVIYPGHEEGMREKEAILKEIEEYPQERVDVLKMDFINQKNNPPIVIAMEKKY